MAKALVKTQVPGRFPCSPATILLFRCVVRDFFRLTESQYPVYDSIDLLSLVPMLRFDCLQIAFDNMLKFVKLQLGACILIGKLIRR